MIVSSDNTRLSFFLQQVRHLAGHRYLAYSLVALMTGLAFLMRRKGLATQSLWFDEADLAARAQRDFSLIMSDFLRPGENGPLYTLFMHFWIKLAGAGEAALRTPSLLAGTSVVPLVYVLGRKYLGGKVTGLLAALLITISPYQIWYSQDAKMYPLALALTIASVLLFLLALEKGRTVWWVIYVLLTTLSFYIHLMSVLIVAVEVVYYWLTRSSRRDEPPARRRRARLALGILTLPYLPIALWQSRALLEGGVGKTWFQPVGLFEMLNTLGRRFAVNRIPDPLWETSGALFFAVLAGLGMFVTWRTIPLPAKIAADNNRRWFWYGLKDSHKVAGLLTLYLLFPIGAFYLLSTRIPLFAERYLLIASPAYYLFIAAGLTWLIVRAWPAALLSGVVVVLLAGMALFNFNYTDVPQKEDWREAMRWLQTQLRPDDHIIILPGYTRSVVDYYLQPGSVPINTIPQALLDGNDDPALNAYLTSEGGITRGHERAWLIVSPDRYKKDDPKEYVRKTWYDYNTWMFQDPKVFLGVTIYGYTYKQIPGTDADFYPANRQMRTDINFGPNLMLEGYSFQPGLNNGLSGEQVRYDNYLHLSLYWRKLTRDKTSYLTQVRVINSDGKDTGISYNAQPLGGYYPTSLWKVREAVRDYRDIYIHLPPGEYFLELQMYPDGQPQQLLPLWGSQAGQNIENSQPQTRLRLSIPFQVIK